MPSHMSLSCTELKARFYLQHHSIPQALPKVSLSTESGIHSEHYWMWSRNLKKAETEVKSRVNGTIIIVKCLCEKDFVCMY